MKHTARFFRISVSIIVLFSAISSASIVHFRIDVSDDSILVGEQSIVNIYGYAQDVPDGNGLIAWGMDLLLDSGEDGIVEFVSASFEHIYDVALASFPDDPYTGMANLGTFDLDAIHRPSQLGIGATNDPYLASNYTLLAQVTVEGIAEGTVTYDAGGIFYSELENESDPTEQFRSDFSSVEINVVPEPMTLLLLAPVALILRRRRLRI